MILVAFGLFFMVFGGLLIFFDKKPKDEVDAQRSKLLLVKAYVTFVLGLSFLLYAIFDSLTKSL
jgi:hypothetical protein